MAHNVLLIGGHGKVSQLLTPLLLAKSWNVTSLIRSQDQVKTIENLGEGQPGKLNVLVASLEEVKSEGDAKKILEQVSPDWVVWSAGAGGKGGPSRTQAIDHDAAISFTKASVDTPTIKKFLNVSYINSRRNRAPWWDDTDWESSQHVNTKILPAYFKAKVAADEVLEVLSRKRVEDEVKRGVPEADQFHGISLRPSTLTDKPAGGISLGKIKGRGENSRVLVAQAIVSVLETTGARGWLDLLQGDEDVGEAVKRVAREKINTFDGEDLEAAKENVSKL